MISNQFHEFVTEMYTYVDLKLIVYWVAGIIGILMNWFKMWLNNEISCGFGTWIGDNRKSTVSSFLTFLASGFALIGLDGFDQMTYVLVIGAGYAAATTSEAYLNRVDRKYYTGDNVGLIAGVKSLSEENSQQVLTDSQK